MRNRRSGDPAPAATHALNVGEGCQLLGHPDVACVVKLFTADSFPPPADRYCNMLPIRTGEPDSIPKPFRAYASLISECERHFQTCRGVLYLTVHESLVTEEMPQRRGGIHTDGFLAHDGTHVCWYHWGGNVVPGSRGGILTASSVSNSTRIWDVSIPRKTSSLLSLGCDLDHLRPVLDDLVPSVMPLANEVFWLTDTTPHESIPLPAGTYRQFFRLVVGGISAWWQVHSTENPKVPVEASIIKHSKFEDGAYERVVVGSTVL